MKKFSCLFPKVEHKFAVIMKTFFKRLIKFEAIIPQNKIQVAEKWGMFVSFVEQKHPKMNVMCLV